MKGSQAREANIALLYQYYTVYLVFPRMKERDNKAASSLNKDALSYMLYIYIYRCI